MSRDRPWMKFYLDDWCDDLALSLCSLAAQGLWMRMLRVMHHADPYGHLLINGEKPSLSDLSRALNVHHKTLITPLNELASRGVYSVDKNGVIFSRRMVRDHRKSLSDKENGRLGGNPRMTRDGAQGVNPPDKPPDKAKSQSTETRDTSTSLRSVDGAPARRPAKRRSVACDHTLPASLTPAMALYAAQAGFVNGHADQLFGAWRDHHIARGTPIADADASFRTWVRNEIRFSKGSIQHGRHQPKPGASVFSDLAADLRAAEQRHGLFDDEGIG